MDIRSREPVILATDFSSLVAWYCDALGFSVVKRFEEHFHYCNLESASGVKLGIALAGEMGVEPADRSRNSVVLQFEVDDLKAFFAHVESAGGTITSGPSFDADAGFWFGGFADPEGNPFWVVDAKCP
ncbi:MAG: VOC family protein [Planctomycetota bacterium]|jgi:predicted enzyme related to lactoylglutathione lyase